MIKEAIEKIQALALAAAATSDLTIPLTQDFQGTPHGYSYRTVSNQHGARLLGDVIQPFRPPKLDVTTLTGFVDALKAGVCGKFDDGSKVVHVEDFLTVSLKETGSDAYGVRNMLLKAVHTPIDAFKFDDYYQDPQKFIIGLQVAFLQNEELLNIIKLVSALKAGESIETQDNGYAQTVTVKRGEIGTADVPVPPRVKLIPLRSFTETTLDESNPVASEFLLRFKQGPAGQPTVALFTVDGSRYKAQIMQSIKNYLEKHLTGIPILA